jgi:hypothetical protein
VFSVLIRMRTEHRSVRFGDSVLNVGMVVPGKASPTWCMLNGYAHRLLAREHGCSNQ